MLMNNDSNSRISPMNYPPTVSYQGGVDIYKIKIDTSFSEGVVDSLMQFVAEERRERVKRFIFPQDALRCLLGDLLSRYAIGKRTGYKNIQLKFGLNAYSKPILIYPSGLHFNVSHSGDWVVCAVADTPVGIDIEHIKAVDFHIAKRFFTEKEYSSLMNQDPENQLKYFYILWTLKESYIKADGRGLSLPLNSFSMDLENDKVSIITDNELSSCFFKIYDIDDNHISSVCSLENNFNNKIIKVTVKDLLEALG